MHARFILLAMQPGRDWTLPFAVTSGRARATTEVRLLLLGGLVGAGVARPFEAEMRWKLQLSFGQNF